MKLGRQLLLPPLITAAVALGCGALYGVLDGRAAAAGQAGVETDIASFKTVGLVQTQLTQVRGDVFRTLTVMASLSDAQVKAERERLAKEVQRLQGALEAIAGDGTDAEIAQQVAAALRRVHTTDPADFAFLPHAAEHLRHKLAHPPPELDEALQEGHVRGLLSAQLTLLAERPLALLHGDFWSGNLIWQHGRLAAIIDWEDACLGDPLADVSNARLELLWKFGAAHMTAFTEAYRVHAPFAPAVLAFWDLAAALRAAHKLSAWGLDAVTEQRMIAQHREFVAQAQRVLVAQ